MTGGGYGPVIGGRAPDDCGIGGSSGASVRVWQIASRGRGPRGAPPSEGANDVFALAKMPQRDSSTDRAMAISGGEISVEERGLVWGGAWSENRTPFNL